MAPRKNNKKRAAPRRKAAPRRRRQNKMNLTEQATLSCTRTLAEVPGNAMYQMSNFALADFPRAVAVARAYQHFRITGIKLTWKPSFDSYGGFALNQKPNLYYMIDKGATIPLAITLEGLKAMGAKPRAFDEKPTSVMWKPSVLAETQGLLGPVASSYKISPWLITNSNPDAGVWNPSSIQHNGIFWYIETPGALQTIRLEVELQFQFKKPLIDRALAAVPAQPVPYAVEDASPDGVEGGTDGITIPLVK